MSQSWRLPVGTDVLATAVKTYVADSLSALRSLFAGAAEPTSKEAYMLWCNTTSSRLEQRNAANTAWVGIAPILKDIGAQVVMLEEMLAQATTRTLFVPPPREAARIERVVIVSDTATSSSSGNEWQFGLQNKTATLALFSGTVGTFTTLGGVGGGEIAIDTAYVLTPDQNASVAKDAVLEFTLTATGTVTTLTRAIVIVQYSITP